MEQKMLNNFYTSTLSSQAVKFVSIKDYDTELVNLDILIKYLKWRAK